MDGSTNNVVEAIDIVRVVSPSPSAEECAALRASLSRPLPEVPPRYFYDDVGSGLFEQITGLAVYYQTRTEIALLERYAPDILAAAQPSRVVELGSGAGRKIRLLLDAWGGSRNRGICTMLDINELFLRQSIGRLAADYPGCHFQGVVGDFVEDLDRFGPPGGRLFVFFAGTIGNLNPDQRSAFLRKLASEMDGSDAFLLGIDLVKDPARLEAAYNDPQGVTAAFNQNMLAVLNRRFGANFVPATFAHRALYDAEHAWIEMRLIARQDSHIHFQALAMDLTLRAGAELRTEISCKFTRESLAATAAAAGLTICGWYTDPEKLFALALIRKNQNPDGRSPGRPS